MKKKKTNKSKKPTKLAWLEKLDGTVIFKDKIEIINNLIGKIKKSKEV